LLAFSPAVESGIGIGGRSMGVVRTFLAMEVRFGITPAALSRLDALHRGPGSDQRAIDGQMLARKKLVHLGLAPPPGIGPRGRLPASGGGSSRTPNVPRLHHQRRFRRTSGTAALRQKPLRAD